MGVLWKRPERIKLAAYLPYYKPKPGARHLVWSSRKCRTKNWPCTAFSVPFATIESAKHGFGGLYGLQSSQILNAPNSPNTRQNTKKKLPLLKLTLIKQLQNVTRSLASMTY